MSENPSDNLQRPGDNASTKPALSICIPTYNRADLLKSALSSIAPQVAAAGDQVELIVSDNCSADDTRAIVEWARQFGPIRYHRNDENIGAIPNLLLLARELATGEFCWLLGDDELLRPGAVAHVCKALKEHQDIDYFYVNYSWNSFAERRGKFVTPEDFSEVRSPANKNLQDRSVDRWEQVLAEDVNCLTAMYCSIFRRTMWLQVANQLAPGELYSSVEWTYTPTVIFAKTMTGKPARILGWPWVIVCSEETWLDFKPVALLVRFYELLELLEHHGVPRILLNDHWRNMLSYAPRYLEDIFRGIRLPRLESFSVLGFLIKHKHYRESRAAVWLALQRVSIREAFHASLWYGLASSVAKLLKQISRTGRYVRDRLMASLRYRFGIASKTLVG